jgi:hypothetical protein
VPISIALLISLFFKEPQTKTGKSEKKSWVKVFTKGIGKLFSNKVLLLHSLDMILTATFAYFIIWFYQGKLELLGVSNNYFGIIHAGVILASASILYSSKFWLKVFRGNSSFAVFCAFSAGVGYLAGGLSSNFAGFILMIVLTAGFGVGRSMFFTPNFNKLIDSQERSTINSTINMGKSLVISLINPLFGGLADVDLNRTFVILGLLTLAAGIFSVWVQSRFEITGKKNG